MGSCRFMLWMCIFDIYYWVVLFTRSEVAEFTARGDTVLSAGFCRLLRLGRC